MKRNEMIKLIDDYLMKEFFEGHPNDENGGWDSYQSASNILTVIEDAGMVPLSSGFYDCEDCGCPSHSWDRE